ncbi:copper chaperone PCu(A)C [Nocardia sp. NBC_00508]|uniref:copper chaperone PCu(A)C n=1 Tax=Nocardia sp. NBC_00508 TaxID=2975992 RepID=UPI002E80AB7D|nr:copper chaperone PCu(A)C [Nocardia sp. NBC_00508]WUD70128.1 copper chaperone PCu(A)C [Nocardia sp. NBC_00508]
MSRTARVLRGVAAAAAVPFLLVACSSNDKPEAASSTDTVTISDQWVKAADAGMSAAFADLTNTSDQPRTVVSATSPASDRIELHEVVTDVNGTKTMRPKQGGFVIPAHGQKRLRPGGDHIMFMDLRGPLRTGSATSVTLTFDDGSTTTFTAQVRDFSGNQENYVPDPAGGAPHAGAQTPSHGG